MHFINPGIPRICFVKCSAKAKRVLLTLRVFFEQDQQNVSSLLLNRSLVFEVKGKRSKRFHTKDHDHDHDHDYFSCASLSEFREAR